jgi:hypothetical protein
MVPRISEERNGKELKTRKNSDENLRIVLQQKQGLATKLKSRVTQK